MHFLRGGFSFLLAGWLIAQAGPASAGVDVLNWEELPSLPSELGVAGPFVGTDGDTLSRILNGDINPEQSSGLTDWYALTSLGTPSPGPLRHVLARLIFNDRK